MRIVILGVCAALALLVFSAMILAIGKSRRASDVAHFHRSVAVEVVWALIPCLMFAVCFVPAARQIIASAAAP